MDNKRDLMKYRIEQAKECLELAKTTVDISEKNSVNRSYYCIFHSMRAVLALDGFDSKNTRESFHILGKIILKPENLM